MQQPKDLRILFLCKKENPFAERAANWLKANFPNTVVYAGPRQLPLPPEVLNWKGDLLISFISSWIIPQDLLDSAAIAAINFHPGSPEYPGTGCTNFAFYNKETSYGVTCHYMKAVVDTGNIIAVKRFPLSATDTVYTATQHCYVLLEEIFYEIMECFLQNNPLPVSAETWKRKPYTRRQLDALCEIQPGMSEEEVELRIKATTYDQPWAFIKLGNRVFKLQP